MENKMEETFSEQVSDSATKIACYFINNAVTKLAIHESVLIVQSQCDNLFIYEQAFKIAIGLLKTDNNLDIVQIPMEYCLMDKKFISIPLNISGDPFNGVDPRQMTERTLLILVLMHINYAGGRVTEGALWKFLSEASFKIGERFFFCSSDDKHKISVKFVQQYYLSCVSKFNPVLQKNIFHYSWGLRSNLEFPNRLLNLDPQAELHENQPLEATVLEYLAYAPTQCNHLYSTTDDSDTESE